MASRRSRFKMAPVLASKRGPTAGKTASAAAVDNNISKANTSGIPVTPELDVVVKVECMAQPGLGVVAMEPSAYPEESPFSPLPETNSEREETIQQTQQMSIDQEATPIEALTVAVLSNESVNEVVDLVNENQENQSSAPAAAVLRVHEAAAEGGLFSSLDEPFPREDEEKDEYRHTAAEDGEGGCFESISGSGLSTAFGGTVAAAAEEGLPPSPPKSYVELRAAPATAAIDMARLPNFFNQQVVLPAYEQGTAEHHKDGTSEEYQNQSCLESNAFAGQQQSAHHFHPHRKFRPNFVLAGRRRTASTCSETEGLDYAAMPPPRTPGVEDSSGHTGILSHSRDPTFPSCSDVAPSRVADGEALELLDECQSPAGLEAATFRPANGVRKEALSLRRNGNSGHGGKLAQWKKEAEDKLRQGTPMHRMSMRDLISVNPDNAPMDPNSSPKGNKRKKATPPATSVASPFIKKSPVGVEDPSPSSDSLVAACQKELVEDEPPAPRIMVGPDGSIVLDEESLVVESSAQKRSKVIQETAAIELGEHDLLPRALPRRDYCKRIDWNLKQTKKFYEALSIVGTDFSLMSQLLPIYKRKELVKKYKIELNRRPELVKKALCETFRFDLSRFDSNVSDDEAPPPEPKGGSSILGIPIDFPHSSLSSPRARAPQKRARSSRNGPPPPAFLPQHHANGGGPPFLGRSEYRIVRAQSFVAEDEPPQLQEESSATLESETCLNFDDGVAPSGSVPPLPSGGMVRQRGTARFPKKRIIPAGGIPQVRGLLPTAESGLAPASRTAPVAPSVAIADPVSSNPAAPGGSVEVIPSTSSCSSRVGCVGDTEGTPVDVTVVTGVKRKTAADLWRHSSKRASTDLVSPVFTDASKCLKKLNNGSLHSVGQVRLDAMSGVSSVSFPRPNFVGLQRLRVPPPKQRTHPQPEAPSALRNLPYSCLEENPDLDAFLHRGSPGMKAKPSHYGASSPAGSSNYPVQGVRVLPDASSDVSVSRSAPCPPPKKRAAARISVDSEVGKKSPCPLGDTAAFSGLPIRPLINPDGQIAETSPGSVVFVQAPSAEDPSKSVLHMFVCSKKQSEGAEPS